ncbi:MAG TPA: ribosome maturation factor RimM [Solimonas sp.]
MASDRATLGRVAGVYGIKGWLRIHSETRPIDNILRYKRWWIGGGNRQSYLAQVIEARPQGGGLVAQISDANGAPITDRDIAATLIGATIEVERGDMPKLPQGQYYWVDLIGQRVENVEGVALGAVTDVTSNGAQDVLVIVDGEVRRLIPFVAPQIVKSVDLAAGRIVCDWQPDYDEN